MTTLIGVRGRAPRPRLEKFQGNSVFQDKGKLLKNPERLKNFQYTVSSVYIHLGVIPVLP